MEIRYATNPSDFKKYDTQEIYNQFLVSSLIQHDIIKMTYSHYDRFIVGGAYPATKDLELGTYDILKATYFLERREIGIINVGGAGVIEVDGKEYELLNKECLYIGKGVQKVLFKKSNNQARYFLASAPAHATYPIQKYDLQKADPLHIGSEETSNKRTVYKLIHEKGIQSCQLVMGLTCFQPGSTWNTMPCHKHDRRMEAYFYFDLEEKNRVFHFMGEPSETRHMVIANEQAILSPPWSVHFGTATGSYSFIWAMAGENKDYTDMDLIDLKDVR
jgi:4-deoxy-L-threo-5-hexosulose-uronate ketol-isomerase